MTCEKKYVAAIFAAQLFCIPAFSLQECGTNASYKTNWTVNPFGNCVFVQNAGQFDESIREETNDAVLFMADFGKIKAYFTSHSIIYRCDDFPAEKKQEEGEDEKEGPGKPVSSYFTAGWKNSSSSVRVDADNEVPSYYSYAGTDRNAIIAHAFSRITYHDLYPGIDVEYVLPEKGGLKYSLVVHPGADLSVVDLHYSADGKISTDENGNAIIPCKMGTFTDHAPSCYYDDGSEASGSFSIDKRDLTFSIPGRDASRTLIIDPWTTNPNIVNVGWGPNTNSAYDVDYDNYGNVYAYGSYYPFKLVKLNSAGVIQWVFTDPAFFSSNYGDFAVNRTSGTCYLVEGVGTGVGGGAKVIKVNSNGTQVSIFPGDPGLLEMWRTAYDPCDNQVVIAGGGNTVLNQACMLDTNMTAITPVNVLGATNAFHDMSLLCTDPASNNCFMATNRSNVNSASFDNRLLKLPMPSLSPATFNTWDGFTLHEAYINGYVLGPVSIGNPNSFTNGLNGMAAGTNWLYTYDGTQLNKINKNTGAIVTMIWPYTWTWFHQDTVYWSGLDADLCDNVYVGVKSSICVYNSSLVQTQTIPLSDTVYDVKVGQNNLLYACGQGFVSCITVTGGNTTTFTMTHQDPPACSCTGTATAHFTMTCGDTSNLTYTWSTNPVQTGQTAVNLCPGTYTVTVSLASGCSSLNFSDTVTIAAPAGTLSIASSQNNVSCHGGTNGSAAVNVTGGSTPYTYAWSPAGGNNATASNLAAGTYSCLITDANGCSQVQAVTITEPAALSVTTNISNISCMGGNGSATVNVSGGSPGYTYAWAPSGGNNSTATNLAQGNYTCTITDTNGCVLTQSVSITQPAALAASFTPVNVTCNGGANGSASVSVNGGTPAYTYAWAPSGGTGASASNLPAGTYTCTVTDANGCTLTVAAVITEPPAITTTVTTNNSLCGSGTGSASIACAGGTSPYSYSWSPSGGTNATATGLSAGNYTCTITDNNGCSVNATALITQQSNIVLATSITGEACFGDSNGSISVTPSGGTGPYVFSWSSGGASATENNLPPGNYTVTVTDQNGCVQSDTFFVTEPPPLIVNASSAQSTVCTGQNTTVSASISGGSPSYTYSWSPGNLPFLSYTFAPTASGTYTMNVTDANGCSASDSVSVNVSPAPVPQFAASDSSACEMLCVDFTNNTSGATAYTWYFGDGDSSNVFSPTHCYTSPGNYNVTLYAANGGGCSASVVYSNLIHVYPSPHADFLATPATTTILQPVISFTDTSSGAITWWWNFGDGIGSSFSQDPVYTYTNTGEYYVTLTVTNSYGCTDTAGAFVYINEEESFYAPNTFTPNGDGINDVFTPKGTGIDEGNYHLMIFDRWGNLIWETREWGEGWDGRANGGSGIAQIDTYVWKADVSFRVSGTKKQYIGHVNLVK
ncbi:MAG TPA: PKD domain-containing protein [Bacteroidia bacterium]|nr:PKD domain-containing protein [Bacteroidia bacterium]